MHSAPHSCTAPHAVLGHLLQDSGPSWGPFQGALKLLWVGYNRSLAASAVRWVMGKKGMSDVNSSACEPRAGAFHACLNVPLQRHEHSVYAINKVGMQN